MAISLSDPGFVGWMGVILLLLLLVLRMPIAFVMGLVGIAGFTILAGQQAGFSLARLVPYTAVLNMVLMCIPMFLLMGQFAYFGGLTGDLYSMAQKWIGHLPGGLAQATIVACAFFAAVSGSSVATAATMASVAVPEMRKRNYNQRLAVGTIAAGGTLGILIPPSSTMIIYGILTEVSIGKMFIAGIIPGITQALFYMALIFVRVKLNPSLAQRSESYSWSERFISLRGTWPVVFLFSLVIGGMYFGIFTATEAAAMGAFGTLLLVLFRKRLTRQNFTSALLETSKITCMILFIIIGAYMFGYFLGITRIPSNFAAWVVDLGLPRYGVLVMVLFLYLILGCFMDALAMTVLTMPVVFPLIIELGFDPIWFGILYVRLVEIGLLTPPFGLNVFVVKGFVKDVPMSDVFRGILPYVGVDFMHVAILIALPQLSLFLPNLMKGS